MKKKLTGVSFTPNQFRELHQCVECGKAGKYGEEQKCESCIKLNLKHCDMCEILLRNGVFAFYTYDIKEDHRENGVEFKANKERIREFIYYKEYFEWHDQLCAECMGWEKNVKNKCWGTGVTFKNTKENYKLNGNMHPEYAQLFEAAEIYG